jgi:hypothetical protein
MISSSVRFSVPIVCITSYVGLTWLQRIGQDRYMLRCI